MTPPAARLAHRLARRFASRHADARQPPSQHLSPSTQGVKLVLNADNLPKLTAVATGAVCEGVDATSCAGQVRAVPVGRATSRQAGARIEPFTTLPVPSLLTRAGST